MEDIKYFNYESPEIDIIEICTDGILCGSNEGIGENDGVW